MKLVSLRNTSSLKLSIMEIPGLVFLPGETKRVTPVTVKHPTVSKYLGRGLLTLAASELPVEPLTPAPLMSEPKASKAESATEPKPAPVTMPAETTDTAGNTFRETLLSAPGVTERNVDDILRVTPSLEHLKTVAKDDLADAGLTASTAKKLLFWAQNQR